MTGLRTIWGLSMENFESRFGMQNTERLKLKLERFLEKGLLENRVRSCASDQSGVFSDRWHRLGVICDLTTLSAYSFEGVPLTNDPNFTTFMSTNQRWKHF